MNPEEIEKLHEAAVGLYVSGRYAEARRAWEAVLACVPQDERAIEGIRMVLKLFEDTSERLGLQRVKTIGERFDPAVHEALQQMESPDHPPGTIMAEIAPGYRFGERLVRPAMVVVARKPSEQSKPDGNVPIQTVPE